MRAASLLFVFLCCASVAASAARLEDDTFADASLNTCRWFEWSQGGAASQGNGLRLQTGTDPAFSQARVISQYRITGDLGMEVAVAVDAGFDAAIPASAQMYAAFGLWADEANWVFIALAKSGSSPVIRMLRSNSTATGQTFQSFPDIPVAGNTARLRVAVANGQIELAYRTNGDWVPAATVAGFGADTYVLLQATTVGVQRQFAATFTDFAIASGTTSYRPYVRGPQVRRTDFMNGAVVGDYIDYREWSGKWTRTDPIQALADNGMAWVATDVTTLSSPALAATPASQWKSLPWDNAYWRSQEITGQVMKEIAARGMNIYLQLYLTEESSYYGKQNAPTDWQTLTVEETATRLKDYTRSVVASYKAAGISIGAYAIGNEIENGILNFYPAAQAGGRIPLQAGVAENDITYLKTAVWPVEATLLKAAIEGVKASDPEAKIVLHAAGTDYSPADMLTKAFFKAMIDQGVDFDYAALSHPYAIYHWNLHRYTTDCWIQRLQETTDYIAGLGKQTIISEGNYPNTDGAYNGPAMADFPYTPAGQAAWVREMLRFGNNNPNIAGFYYWDADYYRGVSEDPSTILLPQNTGLFDANEQPQPALSEFKRGTLLAEAPIDCLFSWAERTYTDLLVSRLGQTQTFAPYTFRAYAGSGAYLAESAGSLFYLGPASGNTILDVGSTANWLATAGCM
jgi:arabinogalactan endo-1,4-beta-galactosidase